jgi:hypothetical protein
MSDKGMCEAFMRCVELAIALKIPKLPDHDGCWEHQVDDTWFIAMNGHKEKQVLKGREIAIEPYTVYVQYNGWPAGLFDYYGGTIAAGEGANENTFIAALVAAKERSQSTSAGVKGD